MDDPNTETIQWAEARPGHALYQLPDDDTIVMIYMPDSEGEPVWLGYLDDGQWRFVDRQATPTVTHWAHIPKGPART